MSVLMGIQGGIQNKKIHTGRMCAVGRDTTYRAFYGRDKGGCGEAVCGHPCFPAPFLCRAAGVPAVCPAFSAFRPGKEAGHEDEVQEDARRAEGQLLL